MEKFINMHGVLNKDYKEYVIKQSGDIIKNAQDYAKRLTGIGIEYLASSKPARRQSRMNSKTN